MHKIYCDMCGAGLYSDLKLKEWSCSPCLSGIAPSTLTCIACSLSNGVFINTHNKQWLHLFCALLLKPYIKSTNHLKIAKTALNCTVTAKFPEELYKIPCFLCKSINPFPVISCFNCKESMHIACVVNRSWKINGENFECGCSEKKKSSKKMKNHELPPVRGPRSCLILEHIMEKIIKADNLMMFRDNSENCANSYKESVLETQTANCYIDATSDYVSIVIAKDETQPTKKFKLTTPANILHFAEISDVVSENEPKYVKNYRDYEDKKLQSLDHIYKYYVRGHAYFAISQVLSDMRKMIFSKLISVKTPQEKIYINKFWDLVSTHLKKNKKTFEDAISADWKSALETNSLAPRVTTEWHKEAFESRTYKMIDDYQEVSIGTKERLKTRKKGCCKGKGCSKLCDLGPFDLINSTWTSTNPDRSNRVECSSDCDCQERSCKNRQISLKQFQKLKVDVREVPTWGFDVYTYRNILAYIRHPVSQKMHKFISRTLSKAINSVCSENWNIINALKYIIEDDINIFTLRDKRYADGLKNAIEGLIEIIGQDDVLNEFRIHPKGTGVICSNPKGIPQNSLIVEYFGQLYSPAKWYEKQDLIKSLVNKIKKKEGANEALPDFYNIMLERHHDDPDGYDVLIVDPIFSGNYGSRLSHSCTPNCGTVTMVAQGKYSIGMYALTDINYLDELTFDYNSITESKEEHLNAVCLCASSICRSYYLSHAQNSVNIPTFHNFLHRASLMLKATISEFDDFYSGICEKFYIRAAVLSGCPEWFKVWVALVLQVVEKEAEGIQQELYKKIAIDSRLQNLVMTVDKVKYCMGRTSDHPPYHLLSKAEVLDYLWGNSDTSLRLQLKKLLSEMNFHLDFMNTPAETVEEARGLLLRVKDSLKARFPHKWRGAGISDMLHLIANTRIFFTELCYTSFNSDPVLIRACEISKSGFKPNLNNNPQKKYSALHIQGTMCGWYKQTVEKPAASLSADKRGTLSVSSIEGSLEAEYPTKLRNMLLEHLRERPHSAWPTKANYKYPWGNFTNKAKVLGTPMFDAIYFDDICILHKAIDSIDLTADNCPIVETFENNMEKA